MKKTDKQELMTLCSKTPAAFPRESCKKAINWFEQNIDQARPGVMGKEFPPLNNLELSIRIESGGDFFNLSAAIGKGLTDFKKNINLLKRI